MVSADTPMVDLGHATERELDDLDGGHGAPRVIKAVEVNTEAVPQVSDVALPIVPLWNLPCRPDCREQRFGTAVQDCRPLCIALLGGAARQPQHRIGGMGNLPGAPPSSGGDRKVGCSPSDVALLEEYPSEVAPGDVPIRGRK